MSAEGGLGEELIPGPFGVSGSTGTPYAPLCGVETARGGHPGPVLPTMEANDTTPPEGERPSDDSYPQRCPSCEHEWTHIGLLYGDASNADTACSECGLARCSLNFYRWWLVENCGQSVEVTVEVSAETVAAAEELCERLGWDRREALMELVRLSVEFEEGPVLGGEGGE